MNPLIENTSSLDFIREIVAKDNETGKHDGRVHTRFPPEPNGYLHIGHAKAICLDFGVARENSGKCNLRFDDTNPAKESVEFVEAIKQDIRWLGFEWDNLCFASNYFEQMYEYAEQLIEQGVAYVCDLSSDKVREYRGTLTESGKNSPFRNRTVDENLDIFRRMRKGEFPDGAKTLRAKIDMASPNMNMRDPALYRIKHQHHHNTGNEWCIYPMYDYAHCLEDSIEGITHSFCTLEFEDNRPLYDWVLDRLEVFHPQQTEFARLNLTYTIMSKRKLAQLVDDGHVSGWDDPRMPTLSGLRRRGVPPEAIRSFIDRIGIAKRDSNVDMALLEYCIRDDLNIRAERRMGVLDPLRLVIENYPEDKVDELECINNPEDKSTGSRKVSFSKVLYIERDDFQEIPHKKFKRLAPGREIRLRYAYFITCTDVIKDDCGNIVELRCTYDPETRGGSAPDGRKVKGTIHWVSAEHGIPATIRLYDRLFTVENPMAEIDFTTTINPNSLIGLTDCIIEPSAGEFDVGVTFQFERKGYFCKDPDSTENNLILNRTITLRDTWKKIQRQTQR